MTTQPFDVNIALKHPERVITRNGKKISEIHKLNLSSRHSFNLVVVIEDSAIFFNEDGKFFPQEKGVTRDFGYDLFLLPDYKEKFVNVYTNHHNDLYVGGLFDTLEIAKSAIKTRLSEYHIGYIYLKTIKITSLPYEPNCNQKEAL